MENIIRRMTYPHLVTTTRRGYTRSIKGRSKENRLYILNGNLFSPLSTPLIRGIEYDYHC